MRTNLTIFILAISLVHLSAGISAQQVTLTLKNVSLTKVLTEIKGQTGYDFVIYEDVPLNGAKPITLSVKEGSLNEVLNSVLGQRALTYEIEGKTIVVKPRSKTAGTVGAKPVGRAAANVQEYIGGRVVDEKGKPLAGVTVSERNNRQNALATNQNGEFSLPISSNGKEIVFAMMGYKTTIKTLALQQSLYIIKLTEMQDELEEVVATGIVERSKESFTGATSTFSGQQLLAVGNTNVVQSLKTLDPSFLVVENSLGGSDPNRLANIEIRGRSSFTTEDLENTYGSNPNLPLFILDGFESDLRTITDISIHRIARITLLKDAASTALYGSRAANGVVVVETKQPLPGKIEVGYSSDIIVQAPFLNDYNLMNAAEKLEFERLSGQFNNAGFLNSNLLTEADYYRRLADVKRGVDTYWMSEPLRTAWTQGHNLTLSGGSEELRFNGGINYKKDQGVMKGSGRDTWRGSVAMTYRKGKLNITNQLFVNGYTAKESPYGSFANFAQAVPYYQKYGQYGVVSRYLNLFQDPTLAQGYGIDSIANPLYAAQIGNRDNTKDFGFTNNLQANYDINSFLRLSGSLSLGKNTIEQVLFRPAENPEYDLKIPEERGLYRNNRTDNGFYQGSVMLTYARMFGERHRITANLRGEVQENRLESVGFAATGFSMVSNGNPNLSSGYLPYSRPSGSTHIARRNNLLGSINYMLSNRYLFDFNYRYDGSTAFGSAKRYASFWSTGIGWNIHQEEAIAAWQVFDLLKLRGSIGYTGNQQFNQLLSVNVYQQLAGKNIFGEMADLIGRGNPNLEWQRTQNISLGIDYGLWNNRLNGYINLYRNHSSPLVVPITQASSTGVDSYYENLGTLTYKGIEGKVNYGIIYKPKDRLVWNLSLTAAHNKGTYNGFGSQLENLNSEQRLANSYSRFQDGYSPEAIWAVSSAGIDPLTGKELFLTKAGQLSFDYNANDEQVLGSTRPVLEGVIGSNFNYKGFSAGVYLRYHIQSDLLNTALYNKVENLSSSDIRSFNLDKRALYDRWMQPGDIAGFKSITDHSYTPISSRFIQQQSFLSGESITLSYRFLDQPWLKKSVLSSLTVSGYSNDLFRWSTIRNERGLEYPFARSFSLNINASF